MPNFKHILVAMDEMPASKLLLDYVADLAGEEASFVSIFFTPWGCLPAYWNLQARTASRSARNRAEKVERQQEQWEVRARSEAESRFKSARAALTAANVADSLIGLLRHREDLAGQIRKTAGEHNCGTIVVGRSAYPWLMELFQTHTGEPLVASPKGIAVRVVD